MDEHSEPAAGPLTRAEASEAVAGHGWRYALGVARTYAPVRSLSEAADIVAHLADECGADGDERLLIDIRPGVLVLTVQNLVAGSLTASDAALVRRISANLTERGLRADPRAPAARSVQVLEIAIDALDIASIRPFWKAALGYGDEPGHAGPQDAIIDPVGQGPAVWFQQMAEPRPQRNRIHLDISVPHDEAQARIEAALKAGGTLVSDSRAPAFWVLADAEGNEACMTTWQGRDG
ncbi:MAG TPA: VOC family protein [Streptosporangiaceae bacterium]|nr:VOC family protein [Streptosporangiaceae bacterium]